jgi:hypothetical protein
MARRLVLFAVSFLLLCACAGGDSDSTQVVTPESARVVDVLRAHQRCRSSTECALVWTDCSSCECGTPVNVAHVSFYQNAFAELCEGYRGPVCEMYCPPVELRCVAGVCESVGYD